MSDLRESELKEIVEAFLVETKDNLDQFELALLELESSDFVDDALQAAFRCVHSIKGACGFLGFAKIEAVTHAGETVLGRARDGEAKLEPAVTTALLRMTDVVRQLLLEIETTGNEGATDVSAVVEALERVATGVGPAAATFEPLERGEAIAKPDELRALVASDQTVRVDVRVLERLMNLVGELVLARNQMSQSSSNGARASFAAASQRLNLITSEIQEVAMKTRMQPIGSLWSRFPRMVRELSRATGKQVRIELEGQRTEVDRSLLESLQDPLVHLVRNAVDHGIEAPEERQRAGKSPVGVIRLRAFHEGGLVHVEFSDDGRGFDTEAIRRQAVRRGLLSAEQADRLSEREACSLVFLPGFSTHETATNLSGRGVGLDVVRTNVEHIGGTVDANSRPGLGTTLKVKIPLTLAIIPALLVGVGDERFAIPQASLLEVLRLDAERARAQIEWMQGIAVLRLRGRLLPLAYLHRELSIPSAWTVGDDLTIIVLQADDRAFGLVVDSISDTEEVVVKPLWKRLKGLAMYAGATVLGDGHVALILDAIGLAQRLGVVADERSAIERATQAAAQATASAAAEAEQVLLCGLPSDGRLAIPLASIARLEEVPPSRIERAGDAEVVQYRGGILTLVRVSSMLEERRGRERGPAGAAADSLQVVVCSADGRSVGLVVERILDVVSVERSLDTTSARRGVLGSMVVQGRVTEFLDVDAALSRGRAADTNGALVAAEGR